MKLERMFLAVALASTQVAQAQSVESLQSSREAIELRQAFEPYRLCVADAAGRLLPNSKETAAAIAEAAEPNCAAQAIASLDAMARSFGPPTSSAHADERYRMLRARVVKDVAAGIMRVRQEQQARARQAPNPEARSIMPFRIICTVTRRDGTPWESPVWFTVDRAARRINGLPAVFTRDGVTWNSTAGSGLLDDTPQLAFGSDPEMTEVSASISGTLQSVYQGPCKRDSSYRAGNP